MPAIKPSLFGLDKSNRDFTKKEAWGKNQFNSSFPAALCCYMFQQGVQANYLIMGKSKLEIQSVGIDRVFGLSPNKPNICFAFEAQHTPFQKYVIGTLPRTDLIIQDESTGACIRGLEIKLTALPDHVTCDFDDSKYGSEIVVRPDSIVYLACSIAALLDEPIKQKILSDKVVFADWSDAAEVLPKVGRVLGEIEKILKAVSSKQSPFLMQPVWKTKGKSPTLADNCLDVFVWSDAGFCWFITQIANADENAARITRQSRSAIWFYKMILDYVSLGRFDHEKIIDELSYNTKNDKAFASSGNVTNVYMACENLTKPRIKKAAIKEIILGDGQNLLSPERRFDAILFNSPELFSKP
jgi:type II restriction enzyme